MMMMMIMMMMKNDDDDDDTCAIFQDRSLAPLILTHNCMIKCYKKDAIYMLSKL